ncbi:hypothetical protein OBBRIDRAFT_589855 [Obba rivulosa]|uniref:Uncharacterized protein n=1 Tax=Obba rivulosa TaxID=1052685 RepID=A0A8E2DM59_9APHY|nr:hypothetical protein OBBRIDRAFT_589855 [Obba rivulosa]
MNAPVCRSALPFGIPWIGLQTGLGEHVIDTGYARIRACLGLWALQSRTLRRVQYSFSALGLVSGTTDTNKTVSWRTERWKSVRTAYGQ